MYIGKNGSSLLTLVGRLIAYAGTSSNGYPALYIQLKKKGHALNLLQVEYDEMNEELSISMLSNETWKMMKTASFKKDDLFI